MNYVRNDKRLEEDGFSKIITKKLFSRYKGNYVLLITKITHQFSRFDIIAFY